MATMATLICEKHADFNTLKRVDKHKGEVEVSRCGR